MQTHAKNINNKNNRTILQDIAYKAMLDRNLLPEFSHEALAELEQLKGASPATESVHDMRSLLWSSIDNADSRDLDQLTVAELMPGGVIKLLVAIADVDAFVKEGSAIGEHAQHNTTSVYTAARIFHMLPETLSTDLTSLNPNEDRLAVAIEMQVNEDGSIADSTVYRALVRNHAKLAYNNVAAWLDGDENIPEAIASVPGLEENLRLQDQAAARMKKLRHLNGALSFETIEAKPVFEGDQVQMLEMQKKNRAKEMIADFMIATNGVTARYLSAKGFASIRRVVHTPKRWDRIVEIAAQHKYKLPEVPNPKALDEFLVQAKAADPLRFPDLSLAVIKLLGAGEYVAESADGDASGHFGLAVKDYAHSTAPNRRYPDLLTQRLLKAALEGNPTPYTTEQLDALAKHCTRTEDEAKKVERQVEKSAAALLLQSRIGEQFDAIATGASAKGTWVRVLTIPVEGKLVQGAEGVDVGDRVRVHLISVDIEQGFIDFKNVN
jgi:VacB/RNase II family 3'-5' exoribonuclease